MKIKRIKFALAAVAFTSFIGLNAEKPILLSKCNRRSQATENTDCVTVLRFRRNNLDGLYIFRPEMIIVFLNLIAPIFFLHTLEAAAVGGPNHLNVNNILQFELGVT